MSENSTGTLSLLRRERMVVPVTLGMISRFPTYATPLGLILAVRERGGSYLFAGVVSALFTVGMAVLIPLTSRLVDRVGPRAVLLTTAVAYLMSGIATMTQPIAPPFAVAGLALLTGAMTPPVSACVRALWAASPLNQADWRRAFGFEELVSQVLVVCAPLGLTILMAGTSATSALSWGVVFTSLAAIGLAVACRRPVQPGCTVTRRRRMAGALASRPLLAVIGLIVAYGMPIGMVTLSIPAFVSTHSELGNSGLVYSCWGLGGTLGAVWYTRSPSEKPPQCQVPWFLLANAACFTAPVFAGSSLILSVMLAVSGIPVAALSACALNLVRSTALPGTVTEAFAWASTAAAAGDAAGQQLGGLVIERFGFASGFATAGGVALLTTAIAFATRRACAADSSYQRWQ